MIIAIMNGRRSASLASFPRFWITALLLVCVSAPIAAGQSGYAVMKKIPIPGEGGWDYLCVDESARRLYVSHGTQVEVLDIDSLQVVGNVPKTPGVHGIALTVDL